MRVHKHSSQYSGVGIVIGLLAIPIMLGILVLGIQATRASSDSQAPGPMHITGEQQYPLGIPAITPRANLMSASGPRFTRDDVIQYIGTHPQILGAIPGKPAPVVTSVQFVTAAQASVLLQGESIGLPDSSPVCIVRAKGSFASSYSPPPILANKAEAPATTAVLVFDAHTGNMIISGTA